MGKMYLMCGMSGVGKTTFAKDFVTKHPEIEYLSIDECYETYSPNYENNPWDDSDVSFKVWIHFFETIHWYEMNGYDVLIDTNAPDYVKRRQFIDWFPTFDEHILIYIHGSTDLCIKNNLARKRIIPKEEMHKMAIEFKAPGICDVENRILLQTESCWTKIIPYLNDNNNFILLGSEQWKY